MKDERLNNVSRWLEPFSKKQPRILLHGIDVIRKFCPEHNEIEEDFVVPCIGKLCELMEKNPESHEAQWLAEDRKWVSILPNINGN